jgi:succinate dehydrogenase / fumarate reductase cytochrome b subunit
MSNPLSPHLQVYRWQITSILSILHRITGVVSSLGSLIIIFLLFAIGSGEDFYESAINVANNLFVRTILIGLTFSYLFYFANCVRHLFWDSGYGLELNTAKLTGWLIVFLTVVLTVVFWMMVMGIF